MQSRRALLATVLTATLLVLVPYVQALTFGSQYGEYTSSTISFADGIPVCCTQDVEPPGGAGDGISGPVTSSVAGGDTTGDSGSATLTVNDKTHTIFGSASVACGSSAICHDDQGGYGGVGANAAGDMYDTYSASCTGSCLGPDVTLVWTVTGYFNTAENGTCAQRGCPPTYSAVGDESSIAGLITLHAPGWNPIRLCTFVSNPGNGCMNEIVNYLQGWTFCQGGLAPQYYCPYSSPSQAGQTFVATGTLDLTSLIESSVCSYACDLTTTHPLTLEFQNSIGANTNLPLSEGVTLTSSTFQVFTRTPGWTITSSACGCAMTAPKASTTTTVSASPDPVMASQGTTLTSSVTGSSPTGTVTFSTSSPTGAFAPASGRCTLSSGSCSVSYSDTGSGNPTITASYGGDSNNDPSSGTHLLTVTSPVVSAPLSEPLGMADSQTSSILHTIETALAEPVGVADSAASSLLQTIETSLGETVGVTDNIGQSVGRAVYVALTDSVGVLENLVNSIFYPINLGTITITLHSPVNMLVTSPDGKEIGCGPGGAVVDQIPGATFTGCDSEPETVTIPTPIVGTYSIQLAGSSSASPSGSAFTLSITSFDTSGNVLGTSSLSGTATPTFTDTLYSSLLPSGAVTVLSGVPGVPEFIFSPVLVAAMVFVALSLLARPRLRGGRPS